MHMKWQKKEERIERGNREIYEFTDYSDYGCCMLHLYKPIFGTRIKSTPYSLSFFLLVSTLFNRVNVKNVNILKKKFNKIREHECFQHIEISN